MKLRSLLFILVVLIAATFSPRAALFAATGWETRHLDVAFRGEGVGVGDLNGDGIPDLTYGPFWFAGPNYDEPRRFAVGEPFVPEKGYSDNFFHYILDFNGDGHPDILVLGFPGKEARLYLNPGDPMSHQGNWKMHLVADKVSNESPTFVDLIPGGLPEIVCSRDTAYGFYEAGEDPTEAWTWHEISPKGDTYEPFGHGLGVGDLDGDGRLDVIDRKYWYRQPAKAEDARAGQWERRVWSPGDYGYGGAQILVHDFDGDGDADIVTSFAAHGYGLAWFEQYEPGKFRRHDLLGKSSTDNPYGVVLSQIHALALCDVDGDGRMDFLTGKRYFAHQGKDPGELQEAEIYWFRNTPAAEGGVEFVPHLIHRGSGVGVEVKTADLNDDGKPDVLVGSKLGLHIHLQRHGLEGTAELWKVPGGRPEDDYGAGLTAAQALARMQVPEGFAVDLVAAEPDLVQPIAMCFDSRGRLWVIEGMTYPTRAREGRGKDRILIFEDTNGDGTFDSRKVFVDNANLASGIAVGFGGVYVGAAPYLHFYPDRDGDDVPDGAPEVLLDGWGYQDTHETLNSFTWGPDGWLYGCQGVFTHSRVGAPGTPDAERIPLNAGMWRFHPLTKRFEVYAHGTSNPWGMDYNARGDLFITACVIPHFYQFSQGGRYQRQAGAHFNPWTFDDMKTIADHAHYAGNIADHAFWGENAVNRPPAPADTSAVGGGHAHSGLVIYQADVFPEEYRGDTFFHNLHGHRMVRDGLLENGSGYVARHRPDFLLARNHDHVGVALEQGPDGALYFSDWADPQTCHHVDYGIWDRTNGRIYRVRYGEVRTTRVNVPELPDVELVALLASKNAFHARHARQQLQERAAKGQLDRTATEEALAQFEAAHLGEPDLRLQALWAAHVCGLLDTGKLTALLADPAEEIRGWAVTLLGEPETALPEDALARLVAMAAPDSGDPSLFVRRHLASLLQRLPLEQRWDIAEGLVRHMVSESDPNIPLLCWYGIEPLVESHPARAIALGARTPWAALKEFLTRRAAVIPEAQGAFFDALAKADTAEQYLALAEPFLQALSKMNPQRQPEGWEAAKAQAHRLAKHSPKMAGVTARIGARLGDPEFFDGWRVVARDRKQSAVARQEAVTLLAAGEDPELGELARELLSQGPLRAVAVAALRKFPGRETATALVAQLTNMPANLRNESINLLAAKPEMALVLLQAVDKKQVAASLISPVLLDQFRRFKNGEIDQLIARNWASGGHEVDLADLKKSIDDWKRKLSAEVMSKASASKGREVYDNTCGICHTLFGEGVALGPDLTGSNRADLDYVLENVLAPSALVGKDYFLHVYTMKDGSTLSGILRGEEAGFAKLAMPGGAEVNVNLSDVAKHEELPQSLMPPGLFEALPLDQVADLVKYLASPSQVPLPGADSSSQFATPPPPKDGKRYEGESLLAKAQVSGGQLHPQGMGSFGPHWSGNSQLWWTGGEPDAVLTIPLDGLKPGKHMLALYPTTAMDYALVRVSVGGESKEADLYSEKVLVGQPLVFDGVEVGADGSLKIEIRIIGKNDYAVPSHMVGVDCVDVTPMAK